MKPIQFDLPLDGTRVKNLDELRKHFTLEILDHYRSGRLEKWLASRNLNTHISGLRTLDANEEKVLVKKLCDIFEVTLDNAAPSASIIRELPELEQPVIIDDEPTLYVEPTINKIQILANKLGMVAGITPHWQVIYESILKFAGLETDNSGYIYTVIGDRKEPISIDGLRLVLPTQEQLRQFNPKEKIIFHPLREDMLCEESSVINKFRDAINIRLNYTIDIVVKSLLNLIASPELHKWLPPEQANILISFNDCDEKTITDFLGYSISLMKSKPDSAFTNIFLKKGLDGKDKFRRLAVVSYPFYCCIDDLMLGQKDKQIFKKVFEYIFSDMQIKDDYGSNSFVAPYLDALMNAAVDIASKLNDIVMLYSDFIEDAELLLFNLDWCVYFKDLDELFFIAKEVDID